MTIEPAPEKRRARLLELGRHSREDVGSTLALQARRGWESWVGMGRNPDLVPVGFKVKAGRQAKNDADPQTMSYRDLSSCGLTKTTARRGRR